MILEELTDIIMDMAQQLLKMSCGMKTEQARLINQTSLAMKEIIEINIIFAVWP